MHSITARTFSFLNILTFSRYTQLLQQFGTLDEAYNQINEKTLRSLGLRPDTIEEVLERLASYNDEKYTARLIQESVQLFTIEDAMYPPLLRAIDDPPVFLYVQGNAFSLQQQSVSIVGTRAMNTAGKRIVQLFVPPLVRAGYTTVSGLAFGVDTEVARATLATSASTVAVLAGGLSTITPVQNTDLAKNIVMHGGVIVTEYALDIMPQKHTFIARNRIIAGLSPATLVVQAPQGSGALITARMAQEYNRDVFAVPGSVFDGTMSGCNSLIAQHIAQIASSPDQLLVLLQPTHVPRSTVQSISTTGPSNTDERRIWQKLTSEPQSVEQLCTMIDIPIMTLIALLTQLELHNFAECIANEGWIRV